MSEGSSNEGTDTMTDYTATVDSKGNYSITVDGEVVATGKLDGTEGDINVFFEAEVILATMDVTEVDEADLATMVEARGGEYSARQAWREAGDNSFAGGKMVDGIPAATVAARIRNAQAHGAQADWCQGDGCEYVEIHSGTGSSYGTYYLV